MRSIDSYHPVTKQIVELLETHDVWFETFEHEPVRTSEEASKVRDGYTLSQGAKAIIVRVKYSKTKKEYVMLVMPADRKFDSRKVKAYFSAKDIRFATSEEVADITAGVLPGGVPPFGNLFNVNVIVDPSLFSQETIVFNAGDRGYSIGMKSNDYNVIVKPILEEIV